jgi:hypothetical protein
MGLSLNNVLVIALWQCGHLKKCVHHFNAMCSTLKRMHSSLQAMCSLFQCNVLVFKKCAHLCIAAMHDGLVFK